MKMKSILSLGIFLLSMDAFASTSISYQEAISIAQKNNNELHAQLNYVESAEFLKKASFSTFLPSLTGSLGYSHQETQRLNENKTDAESFNASLNLRYNLFNGFSDYSQVKLADLRLENQKINLVETKAKVSFEFKNAMARYFYAKNALNISKEIKERRKENLDMVTLRFESGRENKGSVLLSKAYLDQAELDLVRAENDFKVSTTLLRKVLNFSDDFDFEITNIPMEVEEVQRNINIDNIIKNTPTLKKYYVNLENSKVTLNSSRSTFMPSLDLNASLGRNDTDFFPRDNKNFSIGASLSWSLFSGGRDFYTVNSNALLRQAAERELSQEYLNLKNQITDIHSNLVEAQISLKVSKSFLEASQTRAEINRSKYNNGLQTFEEWDRIENEQINYQRDFIQKQRDLILALASWEQVQGVGVIQ